MSSLFSDHLGNHWKANLSCELIEMTQFNKGYLSLYMHTVDTNMHMHLSFEGRVDGVSPVMHV